MSWVRALLILSLVVWIGGIIFFAFVVAPSLFTILPTAQLAGNVVSRVLFVLHRAGIVSGIVFLLCSVTLHWHKSNRLKVFAGTHIVVLLMLLLTVISQYMVTPKMETLRAQKDFGHEFDNLHHWSERLEGGVLFLGLGVVVLTARRFEDGP